MQSGRKMQYLASQKHTQADALASPALASPALASPALASPMSCQLMNLEDGGTK